MTVNYLGTVDASGLHVEAAPGPDIGVTATGSLTSSVYGPDERGWWCWKSGAWHLRGTDGKNMITGDGSWSACTAP